MLIPEVYCGACMDLATSGFVKRSQKSGKDVLTWTVNSPSAMSAMISHGVNGLITDEPALARQVIEAREALSPIGRLVIWIAGETGFLRVPDEGSTAEDA